MTLKSQQLELNSSEITYKHDKLKAEKDKLDKMCANLESQKSKLLEQNTWLENEIEQLKQQTVSRDSDFNKIDSLERDIAEFKNNADDVIRQKDTKISDLESELMECQKSKELLNYELIKQQKAYEIQAHNLELVYKKEQLTIESSKLSEKQTKKAKPNLKDIKKSNKRSSKRKEVRYHSDTEEIVDLPSRKLCNNTKKSKFTESKHQLKILQQEIKQKQAQIELMSSETEKLKYDLNNSYKELERVRNSNEERVVGLQMELKDARIQYQRLMLDHPDQNVDEKGQLSHIKDEHAKLVVENDCLIKELQDLKQNGFSGNSSVMRMVDDIELTKKQLEDQYQVEIVQLKTQIDTNTVHYQEISSNLANLEQEKQSLLSEYSTLQAKFEKQTIELSKVMKNYEGKCNQVHELQLIIEDNENRHLEDIEELKTEIDTIKESNSNVIKLYEYQNGFFRERVAKEIEFLNNQLQN